MLGLTLWSLALLPTFLGQVESCSELGINYTQSIAEFGSPKLLMCGLNSLPSYRWWRSTSPCGNFISISSCNSGSCAIDVAAQSIQRYFYYCCTDGNTETIGFNTLKDCFYVNVCTRIVSNQINSRPSVAVFGQTLPVYVEVYGEPIPNLINQPTVELRYGGTRNDLLPSNLTSSQTVYSSADSPLLVWIFSVKVPDVNSVNYGGLDFSVGFTTVSHQLCTEQTSISYMISVVKLEGAPTTTTDVTTTDTLVTTESGGCLVWTILFAIFLIITIVLSAVLIGGCIVLHLRRTSGNQSFLTRARPGSLPYNPLATSSSVTPTPVSPFNRTIEHHGEASRETQIGTGHPHTHTPEESRRANETHYEEIPGAQTERDSNGVQTRPDHEQTYSPEYIDGVSELPEIIESKITDV